MSDPETCPLCKHGISVEKSGDLEMVRCTNCSWRHGSTVYQGPIVTGPEAFFARLECQGGQVSLNEAMVAKKLIPLFSDLPVSTVLKLLRQSPVYDLGMFKRFWALELQENAKQQGLSIILEPAS